MCSPAPAGVRGGAREGSLFADPVLPAEGGSAGAGPAPAPAACVVVPAASDLEVAAGSVGRRQHTEGVSAKNGVSLGSRGHCA